jgi:hypothetical protein
MKTLAALAAAALVLLAAAPAAPAQDKDGFKPLFDGKSLDGWDGNPKLWSVKDGAIVGETTPSNPAKGNTFLIWKGGTMEDGELRFSFRLTGGNNSGVQYRSKDFGNWVAGGYQYDINSGPENMGKLYDERGPRGRMALGGEKVVWPAGEKKKPAPTPLMDKEALAKLEKKGDWNEGAVIAQGGHLIHKLNGVVVADITDEDGTMGYKSGIVALQIHAGGPMKIEFKDIKLKTPGK